MPDSLTPEQRERIFRDLRQLTRLLDTKFEIPGTKFRFGIDPLLGLLPVIGDGASMLMSLYIILQAKRLGLSRWTLTRMVGNVALDTAVGSIPILGQLFDFAYKANVRNLRLLNIPPEYIDITATPVNPGEPHHQP